MPAHKNKQISFDLAFWQQIWLFFIELNFQILPPELAEYKEFLSARYFILSTTQGRVFVKSDTLENSLEVTTKLWQKIKKMAKKDCLAEWNYIGNKNEKNRYLKYLDYFFWINQNEEQIINREDYSECIAQTFKICKCIQDLNLEIRPAIDFMSPKSQEFLLKLQSILPDWELNNYLINDSEGNFHWQILANSSFLFEGWIFKSGKNFVQKIVFKQL